MTHMPSTSKPFFPTAGDRYFASSSATRWHKRGVFFGWWQSVAVRVGPKETSTLPEARVVSDKKLFALHLH